MKEEPNALDIQNAYDQVARDAKAGGYHLNPDIDFTLDLLKGLLVNGNRYGYWACPCRLASGKKEKDLDIICPCDYRDADLNEFGACFCALYVSQEISDGHKTAHSIPERRLPETKRSPISNPVIQGNSGLPVWRCRVCGYLCARENPPEVCPICKAKKERFETFPLRTYTNGSPNL